MGKKPKELKTTVKLSGEVEKKLNDSFAEVIDRINEVKAAQEKMAKSAKSTSSGFTVMKGALSNLVADGIEFAASGLKDLIGSSIEVGMNFSSAMSEVQAISGATGEDLSKLETAAREAGATTVFSASEAAEALKYMSLAGWDANQSTAALGGVLDLAAASGMELGQASDMVTDYLSAFNMKAEESAYFADMLTYAQKASNTSAAQLGEAYKNCAAALNAAGQDVETVTSMLEAMANQGTKGSEAGTKLNAMMRDLTAKMKDGAITIGDTSIAVMDAQGNYRDLTDIIMDVSSATYGMGDAEKAMALSSVFTSDSMSGLNQILNEGIYKVAGYEEALRKSGGTAKETAETMNDNLAGDLKKLDSSFETLQNNIFDSLEQPLRTAAQTVTGEVVPRLQDLFDKALPIFEGIAGSIGPVLSLTIDFADGGIAFLTNNMGTLLPIVAGLTGAFAAYKAAIFATNAVQKIKAVMDAAQLLMSGKLTLANTALGASMLGVSWPILAIVAGIGLFIAAGVALWKNLDKISEYVSMVWQNFADIFSKVGEKIDNFVHGIDEKVTNFIRGIGEKMKGVGQGIVDFFKTAFGVLDGIVKAPINAIISIINGAVDAINGMGFTVPDWVPLIGGKAFTINLPKMPLLAKGGFTKGASIAGEAGTEAVISFDPMFRKENLSYWAKAGQMLGATDSSAQLLSYGTGNSSTSLNITYAPRITVNGNMDENMLRRLLKEDKDELFDMIEEFLEERKMRSYAPSY